MLDIETLGTEPGAVVLSIGAVRFDDAGIVDEFYQSVSLKSCQEAGLEVDADTLNWWLQQGDDAQKVLSGGADLRTALEAFAEFYAGADEIWAFSPSFDCAILGEAYDAVGMNEPWHYRDQRDCRTLVELPGAVDLEQNGTEHHALDDAKYQARTVILTLSTLQEEVSN
jgi:hypothetical protein